MAEPAARWAPSARDRLNALLRPAALEAVALAGLVAVAGWVFAVPLRTMTNYDEGNYLAALADLRHGFTLGRDVYADQPPGWYLLLRLLAAVFGNSVSGVRTGMLVVSLLGVVAAWACARRLGPLPALAAAALLVVAPPYPAQAAQIEADSAAAALALAALALAVWAFRTNGSALLAFAAGALLVCAVSIKLSAATALLPFAAVALARKRLVLWSLLGAAAVAATELVTYRHELGPIAHGAFGQHTSALESSRWSRGANVHRLVHFLNWHTPLAWLVLAGAVVSVWLALRRHSSTRTLGALWLFVPAGAAFVLAMKPLLDHHLVILAVAVSPAAGAALGLALAEARRGLQLGVALAAVSLLVGAGVYQQQRQLVRSTAPEPEWVNRTADWLRSKSQPNDVVATDVPIVAYYARRLLVPDFVDSSFTRLGVGELTPARVRHELDRYHVHVAAIGRAFWADPAIRRVFDRRFRYRKLQSDIILYSGRRRP